MQGSLMPCQKSWQVRQKQEEPGNHLADLFMSEFLLSFKSSLVIKQMNILIKFGKASTAGFKGSLFIMWRAAFSFSRERGGKNIFCCCLFLFCQYITPPILSFSLHKLSLSNISSLIYDCRSYLTVSCGLMIMCMQEKYLNLKLVVAWISPATCQEWTQHISPYQG